MRILHVIESLEPGGAEKIVVHLANAFTAEGHEVHIAMTRRSGALCDQLAPGIGLHGPFASEGNSPAAVGALHRLLKLYDFDVVHLHNWSVLLGGVAAALGHRTRVVMTVHGPYIPYPPGLLPRIKKRLRNALEWLSGWRLDAVAGVSPAVVAYTREKLRGTPCPVSLLLNAVADQSGPCARQRSAAELNLVTAGRLATIKNFPLLIEAMALLRQRGVDARLVVLGEGEERESLQRRIEGLGLSDHVTLAGFQQQVGPWLRCADAFVCSSNYEGISLAILEAMSAGLPVVATAVGGNPNLISDGENGRLVPPGDADALATALEELASEPELRHRMGQNGRARYLRDYAPAPFLARHRILYGLEEDAPAS